MSREAYEQALQLAEDFYALCLEQQGALKDLLEGQQAYIKELYEEGGTDAIYMGIKEQLDACDAMFREAQEKMASVLSAQFEALKNQSTFVKNEVFKFVKLTGLGDHINNVVELVTDMVEQAGLVVAEYQAVIAQMNADVKAKLQAQLQDVLNVYNKAVEQYQTFVRQVEKVTGAAISGDVDALLELLDLAGEDFGIDVDAIIDKCVDDLIAVMESKEVQDAIDRITKLIERIETTALDIYAYGTALASGDEAPFTGALVENSLLQFENDELKANIEELQSDIKDLQTENKKLESDIKDLQKVNETLIINNNTLKEEVKTLKEETKKDDTAYQKLVSNVKNSRKVVKNKVALKQKATKNVKTRKIVVKWSKWTTKKGKITKYQVYYKTKGKKAVKKFVKKSKTKYTTKKLKKGSTYTVKVRAVYKLPYKNSEGKTKYLTYYSKWSKAKKVTIKK
jgi:Tfp pilus assembly protein PilN